MVKYIAKRWLASKRLLTLSLLLTSLLLIASCKGNEPVTGRAVEITDETASLLQVKVQNEANEPIGGADIYVNDVYKGKTSKYGEGKATKLVILSGDKNIVRAEHQGYFASEPILVSSSARGEQVITMTLEKERTDYLIQVENEAGRELSRARVSLHRGKDLPAGRTAFSDKEGLAALEKIDDGNYYVKVFKEGYDETGFAEIINFSANGEKLEKTVRLKRRPHLEVEVADGQGLKMTQAEVTLYSEEAYDTPGEPALHIIYTNEEGAASFEDVEVGESYIVIIKKEGFSAQTLKKTVTEEDQFLPVGMELAEE